MQEGLSLELSRRNNQESSQPIPPFSKAVKTVRQKNLSNWKRRVRSGNLDTTNDNLDSSMSMEVNGGPKERSLEDIENEANGIKKNKSTGCLLM